MKNVIRPALRTDIEGLRGIAILVVVAYHAGLMGFAGGYVGVDVFFVLSGYLITNLLMREMEATNRVDFVGFYARRARRLLPALSLVLLATTLAGFVIYSPIEQRIAATAVGATNVYASNFYFAVTAMNYLGPDAEANPALHTWSLAVEEQFYLVWPLLLYFSFRSARRIQNAQLRRRRVLMIMAVVAVASFALSVWLTRRIQPWAFFSSATRAWEFAVGGLGVLVLATGGRRLTIIGGWLGLGCLLYAVIAFGKGTSFPGVAALLPALGTVAILRVGALDARAGVSRFLSARWLQWIGTLSYSWYLWHWPVLIFAIAVGGNLSLPIRIGCVALSLIPAGISFRFVENPIRRKRILVYGPVRSLALAAAAGLLGLGISVAWQRVATRAAVSPNQMRLTMAHKDTPLLYAKHCISDLYDRDLNECTFGSNDSLNVIVLFGDSHAAQWFPTFEAIATSEHLRLVTLIKNACPAADVEYFYPVMGRRYTECGEWRAKAIERIKQIRPSTVIVTGSQGYTSSSKPLVDLSSWLSGLQRTLRALNDSGARTVYLRATPEPEFDVPVCLGRAAWRAGWLGFSDCNASRTAALDNNLYRLEQQQAQGLPNVTLMDLTDNICPGSVCEPERGNLVIYRDGNHLTATFAASLAPVVREKLITAGDGQLRKGP